MICFPCLSSTLHVSMASFSKGIWHCFWEFRRLHGIPGSDLTIYDIGFQTDFRVYLQLRQTWLAFSKWILWEICAPVFYSSNEKKFNSSSWWLELGTATESWSSCPKEVWALVNLNPLCMHPAKLSAKKALLCGKNNEIHVHMMITCRHHRSLHSVASAHDCTWTCATNPSKSHIRSM